MDAVHNALERTNNPGVMGTRRLADDDNIPRRLDYLVPHACELLRSEKGKCPRRVWVLVPVERMVVDLVVAGEAVKLLLRHVLVLMQTDEPAEEQLLQDGLVFDLLGVVRVGGH